MNNIAGKEIVSPDYDIIDNKKYLLKEIRPLKLKWNAAVTSNIEYDVSTFKNTLEWIVKNKIETVT